MVKPLLILFLLGALQGAVGWIMVASGLTGDAVYVKPTRLALHFIFALGLLAYTLWFALQLLVGKDQMVVNKAISRYNWSIIAILALQLVYGALMAGNKAAPAAPTWPDINGYFAPPGMINENEGLLNLIDNRMTIHFIHRGLAYILCILVILLTIRLCKNAGSRIYNSFRKWPIALVSIQIILGILAVTTSLQIVPNQWGTFEWVAQLHQAIAMLLVLSLISIAFIVDKGSVR